MSLVAKTNEPGLAAQLAKRGEEGSTSQGLYVVGADGTVYGWMNDHHVDAVRQFLDRSLAAYQSSPPSYVQIPQAAINERFSTVPAPTTSLIRVFSRIYPVPQGCHDTNNGIGRDHLWVLANEVQDISAPLHDDGRPFALPSPLVARIARYHLIDNVRGEPPMWQGKEVQRANFSARYIGGTTAAKSYELHGDFAQQSSDGKRGLAGTIDGRFEVATRQAMISRFRAFSQMQAWGGSMFTPNPPPGRFPLMIGMIEAYDNVSRVVSPEAMDEGGDYYLKPEPIH